MFRKFMAMMLVAMVMSACNANPPATEAPLPTLMVLPTSQPTLTSVVVQSRPTITPIPSNNTTNTNTGSVVVQVTAVLPPTVTAIAVSSNTGLLNGGRGLSNGAAMNNGEFQVEGYCGQLNPAYGVTQDSVNWFCTFESQPALMLRQTHFDDICRRTYNNQTAVAIQVPSAQPAAYQWRCYQYIVPPTPVPTRAPILLNNGRGMSTGAQMNNGEFQVEGYCTAVNPNYGVTRDDNYWYCTENNLPILTLGTAEFDDICIRTYNNPAAFAEQNGPSNLPVFRWRCYALGG